MPEMVTLHNGARVEYDLATQTMGTLQFLFENYQPTACKLIELAREHECQLSPEEEKMFRAFYLLQENGELDPSIRNIVQSAAEGSGKSMKLIKPTK